MSLAVGSDEVIKSNLSEDQQHLEVCNQWPPKSIRTLQNEKCLNATALDVKCFSQKSEPFLIINTGRFLGGCKKSVVLILSTLLCHLKSSKCFCGMFYLKSVFAIFLWFAEIIETFSCKFQVNKEKFYGFG